MHGLITSDDVDTSTWPGAILALGALALFAFLFIALLSMAQEVWKVRRKHGQEEELRQLVQRYEQLATNTLDAQQRFATDVSELRSRTSSIEQILRSVE
jgi:dynactin complex subunit